MVLDTLGKEVDIGSLIQRIAPSEGGIYAREVASLMTSEGVPASAFGGVSRSFIQNPISAGLTARKEKAQWHAVGVAEHMNLGDLLDDNGYKYLVLEHSRLSKRHLICCNCGSLAQVSVAV